MKHDCTRCQRLECWAKKRSPYLEFRFPARLTERLEFRFGCQPVASSAFDVEKGAYL